MQNNTRSQRSATSAAALLVLSVLCAAPLAARQIDFVNMGVAEYRAARIQTQIEPAFEHVAARIGLADDRAIFLTIVASGRRFAEIAANDGVAMDAESVLGYAMPAHRRVVLNFAAIDERRLEPLGVLRHEIAHLVMGNLRSPRPLWFEEGLANYIEGIAFNALIEQSQTPLIGADFDGLEDLSAGLRDQRAGESYPESRRVIELIVKTWGKDALGELLRRLSVGVEFNEAFASATGATVADLEARWLKQREEQSGGRLMAWLGANWTWLLFAAGGGLMIAAVIIVRRRGRKQVDLWEEQEAYFPSDPSWSYTKPDEGYSTDDDDVVRR